MLGNYEGSSEMSEFGGPASLTPEAQAKLGQMSLMPVASLDKDIASEPPYSPQIEAEL